MAAGSLGLSVIGMQLTKWKAAGVFLGTNKIAQIFLSNYNKIANRFIYWLHPEKDALGLGYQLLRQKNRSFLVDGLEHLLLQNFRLRQVILCIRR